ncbi:MAG: hypothetical protein EB120_13885, partial [Proteobacteria bacterium]|nr:hypothetical protein [Pseudomonadota bacterium]
QLLVTTLGLFPKGWRRMKCISKALRQWFHIPLLLLLSFFNVSLTWQIADDLLTEEDIGLEETQEAPALSSMLDTENPWKSYNQWQCFDARDVTPTFMGHFLDPEDRSEEMRTPALQVELPEETLVFDLEPEDLKFMDCEDCPSKIFENWREWLDRERAICIYAAHLQDLNADESYWILSKIKTSRGYWSKELLNRPDGGSESDNNN